MTNKALLKKLAQLEQLFELYQNKADKLTLSEHQEQVQEKIALINTARAKLKLAFQKQTTASTAELENLLENSNQLSNEELTAQLQETWPDLLPVTMEVIENCYLTVFNLGMLTYEEGGTPFDTISFTINEEAIENLVPKRNSKGSILIFSNWRYHQENTNIGLHTFGNSTSHSIKNYKISCQFEVNEQGEVNVYKDSIHKLTEEDTDKADLLFFARPIEVDLDNADRLSISGGTTVNTMSVVPQKIKDWLNKKIVGKTELTKTFSLKVSAAAPAKKAPMAPVEKELVFEKENQAVLSSDQREVCLEWWENLSIKHKEAVRNQKAKLVIRGFTSSTGTELYNETLAAKRAQHVAKMLVPKIGRDIEGKPVCRFELIAKGERTDDPKRYVRITVVPIN